MRYALLSDMHANAAALRAAMMDAHDAGAEKIICLGDVVGYGPDPVETLELVHERAHVCLAGNHDDAVAERCGTEDFTEFAAEAVKRQRGELAPRAIRWLKTLPYVYADPAGVFACAHGDFSAPERFNYVLDPAEAQPSWAARPEQLLFVGHSHQPGIFVVGRSGIPHRLDPVDFELEEGKRYIVNPGSVGYPRSGECRSSYCIFDDAARTVEFRTLPFDLESYRAKMNGKGLDEAPWMRAREKQRALARPGVRAHADFAAARPAPAAQPSAARRGAGWKWAVLALALALGGVFWWYSGGRLAFPRASAPAAAADRETTQSAPPPHDDGARRRFQEAQPFAQGWTIAYEDVREQTARFSAFGDEPVAILENKAAHVARLSRCILLAEASHVGYGTRLKEGSGAFQFNFRVIFRDAADKIVGETPHMAKKSVKFKKVKAPPHAVSAELVVDCQAEAGTYVFALPTFEPVPAERRR